MSVKLQSSVSVVAAVFGCAASACMSQVEDPLAARDVEVQQQAVETNWMRERVQSRVVAKAREVLGPGGPSLDFGARIVGGSTAGGSDNPFQVGLLQAAISNNFGAQFCGGTLLRSNIVVTAAHCSDFIADVNSVQVLTGTRRLDGTGRRHAVRRIMIHPAWDAVSFDNDVAVWELATSATGVPTATLATSDGPVGGGLLATGWGVTSEGGVASLDLQRVNVPLVARDNCNDANSYRGAITSNMLCAGRDVGGLDSCQGDSGGPLTRGPDNSVLTGITSWGIGCARPNLFGVYTRVSQASIRSFIDRAIMHYDFLSPRDRALSLDYDGNGDEDLFFYRPGSGAAWLTRSNGDGTFTAVHAVGDNGSAAPNGIAGFDLLSAADRALAFDYNGDGRQDLLFYRPGRGAAWVARSNGDGTFTAVHAVGDNGSAAPNGIAGYDLLSSADSALPFDFNGDGDVDLFFFRPGGGVGSVARSRGDGTFDKTWP